MTTILTLALIATETLIISLLDLFCYVPMLGALVFRRFENLHKQVSSDIPGNPHAFDSAVISLFRTLPEPSNFNLVWTNLPYMDELVVRGSLPFARCNSLSVYGQGSSEPPNSVDLNSISKANDLFEIHIGSGGVEFERTESINRLSSRDWKRGFCALRNYLVPPGTLVQTPEIIRLRDGAVIRKSELLVAGPAALSSQPTNLYKAISRILCVNSLLFASNNLLLSNVCNFEMNLCIIVAGLIIAFGFYKICFELGRKALSKLGSELINETNKFALASLDTGSKASQPSTLHTYWFMKYDVGPGNDVAIRGKINRLNQKYWSVVAYDLYGLPLPQYIYDANVLEIKNHDDPALYEYDIRLTSKASPAAARQKTITELDVSAAPVGYILFRLVHPVGSHVIEYSAPVASVEPSHCAKSKSD